MGNKQPSEKNGVDCIQCGKRLPGVKRWEDIRQHNFQHWGRCYVFLNEIYYRPVGKHGCYRCHNCFHKPFRDAEQRQQRRREERQREEQLQRDERKRREERERKRHEEMERKRQEEMQRKKREEMERRRREEMERKQREEIEMRRRKEMERKRREEMERRRRVDMEQEKRSTLEQEQQVQREKNRQATQEEASKNLYMYTQDMVGERTTHKHRQKITFRYENDKKNNSSHHLDFETLPSKIGEAKFVSAPDKYDEVELLSADGIRIMQNSILEGTSANKTDLIWFIKCTTVFYLQTSTSGSEDVAFGVYDFISVLVSCHESFDDLYPLAQALRNICNQTLPDPESKRTDLLDGTPKHHVSLFTQLMFEELLQSAPESMICITALRYWIVLGIPVITDKKFEADILVEFNKLLNRLDCSDCLAEIHYLWNILHRICQDKGKQMEPKIEEQGIFLECLRIIREFKSGPKELITYKEQTLTVIDLLNSANSLDEAKAALLVAKAEIDEQNRLDRVLASVDLPYLRLETIREKVQNTIKELKTHGYLNPTDALEEQKISSTETTEDYLVLTSLRVRQITGYWPTLEQIVAYWVLVTTEGPLVGVGLGNEGKECIIAMVAATWASQGKQVDIITTSDEEAQCRLEDWQPFYELFGLHASQNVTDESDRQQLYAADIVYGTTSSFADDILKGSRTDRKFDLAIVDDIDSMLTNQNGKFAHLNDLIGSSKLHCVEQILCQIWSTVKTYGHVIDQEGQIHFHDEPQPFFVAVDKVMQGVEGFDRPQMLAFALEHNMLTEEAASHWESHENAKIDMHQVTDFFKTLETDFPVKFHVYTMQENGTAVASSFSEADDEDVTKYSVLLLDGGLACFCHDETSLIEHTVDVGRKALKDAQAVTTSQSDSTENSADVLTTAESALSTGKELVQEYVHAAPDLFENCVQSLVETWVQNAFEATKMKEQQDYQIDRGKILPLELNTENVEWSEGLQNFLEMKHGLALSDMVLLRNFLPYIFLLQQYIDKGSVFGLSDGLGSFIAEELIDRLQIGHFVVIPDCKWQSPIELPGKILGDDEKWARCIFKYLENAVKSKQAALVLCEDGVATQTLKSKIDENKFLQSVTDYVETGGADQMSAECQMLENGEVLVATCTPDSSSFTDFIDKLTFSGSVSVIASFLPSHEIDMKRYFSRVATEHGESCSMQILLNRNTLRPDIFCLKNRNTDKCEKESQSRTIDIQQKLALQNIITEIGGVASLDSVIGSTEVDFYSQETFNAICGMMLLHPSEEDELLWFIQYSVVYFQQCFGQDHFTDVTHEFIAELLTCFGDMEDLHHLAKALGNVCTQRSLDLKKTGQEPLDDDDLDLVQSLPVLLLEELSKESEGVIFTTALRYVINVGIPLVAYDSNVKDILLEFTYFMDRNICEWHFLDIYHLWNTLIERIEEQELLLKCLRVIRHFKIDSNETIEHHADKPTIIDVLRNWKDLSEAKDAMLELAEKEENKNLQTILSELDLPSEQLNEIRKTVEEAGEELKTYGYPSQLLPYTRADVDRRISALREQQNTSIKESLVLASLLVRKTMGYWPRLTQMTTYCILTTNGGYLLEVCTGEGKSCVIAMVAATFALQGKQVDIITSSPVLAKRDADDWKPFYREFALEVANNVESTEDSETRIAYNSNILYGTVGSFAGDILQSNFAMNDVRNERRFDLVIVDEVDAMLIDQGVQFTYLSHSVASTGMRHLEPVLARIWAIVSRFAPVANRDGRVYFRREPQPFFMPVDELLRGIKGYESTRQLLGIAQELGILTENAVTNWDGMKNNEIKANLDKVTDSDMHLFFRTMEKIVPVKFQVHTIEEDHIVLLDADVVENNAEDEEVPVLLYGSGLACLLEEDQKTLTKSIVNATKSAVPHEGQQPKEDQLNVPNFLRNFAHSRAEKWVKNAFLATTMKQNREYIVSDGKVLPVDLKSTGIVELNKK